MNRRCIQCASARQNPIHDGLCCACRETGPDRLEGYWEKAYWDIVPKLQAALSMDLHEVAAPRAATAKGLSERIESARRNLTDVEAALRSRGDHDYPDYLRFVRSVLDELAGDKAEAPRSRFIGVDEFEAGGAAPRAATEPLLSREQVVAAFAAHEGNDCCDPRTLEHVFQTLTGNTLGRAS